jgi:signal transduction histidine kinase
VVTTAVWPRNGYFNQLVYASLIGLTTWAFIEVGRHLVPAQYRHTDSEGGPGWPKGWRGFALTSTGIVVGFGVGDALGRLLLSRPADSGRDLQVSLMLTAVAGAAVTYYFHARGKASAMAAQVAAAERDASEARLRLLQSQLEPHMLFNTLANLRALIGVDPAAAQQMLDRLNAYLRATLNASRATQHPLSAEFDRLADYLELMALRMGPRLQVSLDLPDALRDVPVPPLLLQPLVENAIQHGLEPRVQGGALHVRAWQEGDRLRLEVADTGVGFEPADVRPDRFGLTQVRERVATAYGGAGQVQWQSAPGAGTQVQLTLPLGLVAIQA